MTVIITKYISKKTKNFLKRWFIEPKANIFVGNIDYNRVKIIIDFIDKNFKQNDFSGLIICSDNSIQKYKIIEIGNNKMKKKKIFSGIELLLEKFISKK